jgi:putative phage-type endonuclease
MEQIDLIQGSPEWHEHRAAHFNASDAPAMLGISPYKSRTELLHEMATGITPDVDAATQRRFDAGHRFEALARPLAEKIIGKNLYPIVGAEGKLSASFDGLTADDSICFENKTLNDKLRAVADTADLPDMYLAQIEQQMMLSGAAQTIFMASQWDGDELIEEKHWICAPNPEMRSRILHGWAQFTTDLDEYKRKLAAGEIEQPKPKLIGESIMDLPTLTVSASGMVTYSNLPEFKAAAEQYIARINTDLTTDQQFADAEATVKFCKITEEKLDVTKSAILAQTASIDEVIRTVSHIQAQLRDKRLVLEKLVKSEKESRKTSMVIEANAKWADHVAGLQNEIAWVRLSLLLSTPSFAEAIKGKKLLSAMQEAIDTAMLDGMCAAETVAKDVRAKLAWCKDRAEGYGALFPDLQQLVGYDLDAFQALITGRIEAQKKEEADKLEAQRAKIRGEEEAKATEKAERESAAKLAEETARIRADAIAEEQKRQAEATEKAERESASKIEAETVRIRADEHGKARAGAVQDSNVAVVQHQDNIRAFLDTRNMDEDKRNMIRAYLVEFVKFCATQRGA